MRNDFKKSDLKTGMVVVNDRGNVGVVYLGTAHGDFINWFYNRNSEKYDDVNKTRSFDTIKDDMTFRYFSDNAEGRIVEVYVPDHRAFYAEFYDFDIEDFEEEFTLIYKRVVTKTVSVETLKNMFQCDELIITGATPCTECCGECCCEE